MNPLSPLTYYRRHKHQTLLLVALVSLMTLGVSVMVRLLGSVPESSKTAGNYLTRVSLVSAAGPTLDPGVVSQIRTQPGVAQVIQEKGLPFALPSLGESHVFGVSEADLPILLDACSLQLKEGRLIQPRANEMMLSAGMAQALGLRLGDRIDRSVGEDWLGDNYYEAIPAPLKLVGILESSSSSEPDIRLGIVSYEYVSNHELFQSPWAAGLVVIPQISRKAEVDKFLETEIASSQIEVMTYRQLSERAARLSFFFYLILGVVNVVVAAVIALVIGVINRIAQAKRLEEFGVLNALAGRDKITTVKVGNSMARRQRFQGPSRR